MTATAVAQQGEGGDERYGPPVHVPHPQFHHQQAVAKIFVLTVFAIGIFESALYPGSWAIMTEKFAFSAGSSKHGNARRASVGSKCVVARYLGCNIQNNTQMMKLNLN